MVPSNSAEAQSFLSGNPIPLLAELSEYPLDLNLFLQVNFRTKKKNISDS